MRPPIRLSAIEGLVVVSGASRGIGLEFASQILSRSPAASIVAASRSGESPGLAKLIAAHPGRVHPIACDVTKADDTAALKERVAELSSSSGNKKVDMVINSAGVLHDVGQTGYMPERSLASIDPESMAKILAINAIGPVMVTQAVASKLSRGAIIGNLSARVGSISDNKLGGWWSYRMSKAALNMATVNMAHELKRKDVYSVALHPGTTDTDLSVPFQKNVKPEKL